MYPLRTLLLLNRPWWDLLLSALLGIIVAVMLVFALRGIAGADVTLDPELSRLGPVGVTSDVMPPDMRTDVDTYLDVVAERIASERAEWVENLILVNGPYEKPVVKPRESGRSVTISPGVEQWRPLVTTYFGANTDAALRVLACESGGKPNAKNPNSSASGLFQHLARYWEDRSARAGWAGYSIFDPEANIAVAAWLSNGGASWSHWVCKP